MTDVLLIRRGKGVGHQRFVGGEGGCIGAGHLTIGVGEGGAVKIVIHHVPADHQIADVQLGAEGTGNAGVDQMGDAVQVAENLGADGGVDLADAAFHDGDGQTLQGAVIEFGTRPDAPFWRSAFPLPRPVRR